MYERDHDARSKKRLSPQEAKVKAGDFCAYQERSQQEVRDKLYEYGLHQNEVEEILSLLIVEGLINEERFARAYVRGKFNLKKWGRNKIAQGLKRHKISSYCLKKAWEEIDASDYRHTILDLIDKKKSLLNESNTYLKKKKIVNYLMQRGFESNLIWEVLDEVEL